MDVKELTQNDLERKIIYTQIVKKGKDEFERKEIGRLVGWNDETVFVRFGCEGLDTESLKAFFARHGGQAHFTGCPCKSKSVEFYSE